MIDAKTLQKLSAQRVIDSMVLLKGKRYSAAIYLMGYAIEIGLKRKSVTRLALQMVFQI